MEDKIITGVFDSKQDRQDIKDSFSTEKQLETIIQYIDMDMAEFIVRVTPKSYAETNAMLQLMEAEQAILLINRADVIKGMDGQSYGSKNYNASLVDYITTFVLEQKIIDRISCLRHILKMKGVGAIFNKSEKTTAPTNELSEKTTAPESGSELLD